MSSSKADLKIVGDPDCSWCVYANEQSKLKVGLKVIPLITMRVILRRKNVVQGKSQCSVLDIRMSQLTVLKVCFHLEVETRFVISPKIFNYRYEGPVKLPLLDVIAARALQLDVFPKDSLTGTATGLGILCKLTCVPPSVFVGCVPMTSLPE